MGKSKPKETWRLFWALELPDGLRAELARLQQSLKKTGAEVRYVRPEGIHLTLKFLGNVAPDLVPQLVAAVAPAAGHCPTLELQPWAVGAFPRLQQPRVVWAGLKGDLEPLKKLARAMDVNLVQLGFEAETRPFTPHLTLGRVKSNHNRAELVRAVAGLAGFEGAPFTVRELTLFRSVLAPSGARYTALHRLTLAG